MVCVYPLFLLMWGVYKCVGVCGCSGAWLWDVHVCEGQRITSGTNAS